MDDATLFRDLFADARPVRGGRRTPQRSLPKPDARFSRADERSALDESLIDDPTTFDIEAGDELSFYRPHISRRVRRQLRRGQFAVQDEIDLHGMTRGEAQTALHDFIRDAQRAGRGCVRIIHGKGLGSGPRGPVLKSAVSHWLSRLDPVVAFCSAQPRDGGTGAVYVLLKK